MCIRFTICNAMTWNASTVIHINQHMLFKCDTIDTRLEEEKSREKEEEERSWRIGSLDWVYFVKVTFANF